jgi:hypothetical protein
MHAVGGPRIYSFCNKNHLSLLLAERLLQCRAFQQAMEISGTYTVTGGGSIIHGTHNEFHAVAVDAETAASS